MTKLTFLLNILSFFSRNDDSDDDEIPSSSKKKSKTEVNMLKKRLKNIMKKVIDYADE